MKNSRSTLIIPAFLALFSGLFLMTALLLSLPQSTAAPTAAEADHARQLTCVGIDAGHGGKDGGAIGESGLCEKDVNLAVALALRDLLEINGIPVVMTRTEDILLYDPTADHEGRKKALDLLSRRTIAEHSRDALFVSIHMNAFPQSQYSGTQVWYGTKDALSREISHSIQQSALWLQPENRRKIKAASSSIYLLDQIPSPCVLVECGFLSNPTEAERLSDPNYQKALAVMIFAGISPYVTAPLNH